MSPISSSSAATSRFFLKRHLNPNTIPRRHFSTTFTPKATFQNDERPTEQQQHETKPKPYKITLQPNKSYLWCSCGLTKKEAPLCDLSHRGKTHLKPRVVRVKEEKTVYLCTCRGTKNMDGICDGSHKKFGQCQSEEA